MTAARPDSSFSRWWIYQRERFPVFAHGLLIAAFSASAVGFSSLLRGGSPPPAAISFVTAFVTSFLLFLQLRIADEHKDFDEDCAHRPYRPVPRGLVSLRELTIVAFAAAAIQLALAASQSWHLVALLLVTWSYLALMTREFFIRDWIVHRPVTYLWTHMLIIPLADLYATACDWVHAGTGPPRGLFWFITASFFNGIALEIGRKIRSPHSEESGVRTYSALWGRHLACTAWLGALAATAICAVFAAARIDFLGPVAWAQGSLFMVAVVLVGFFLRQPVAARARRLDHFSGLWTLVLYVLLGLVPLLS